MRSRVERAVHVAVLVLLGWTWWRVQHPTPLGTRAELIDQSHLPAALATWTTAEGPGSVHVRFTSVPGGTMRDWLTALDRAGSRLTWDAAGSSLPATAVDAEAVADPRGVVRVTVATPRGARVTLGDRFGALDSVVVPHGVVSFRLPPVSGVAATVGGTVARTIDADSLTLRRIYLVGRAGWEAKFVARALEEEGWIVDPHFVVSPDNDVAPVTPIALDTASYSAVVLVDTALAGESSRIAKFVESGGGLVLGSEGARAVSALAVGSVGDIVPGAAILSDSAPEVGCRWRQSSVSRLAPASSGAGAPYRQSRPGV